MGKQIESHPDAQSRREMLEQVHRRAGQKLQHAASQDEAPQQAEQQASGDPAASERTIH